MKIQYAVGNENDKPEDFSEKYDFEDRWNDLEDEGIEDIVKSCAEEYFWRQCCPDEFPLRFFIWRNGEFLGSS